MRADELTAGTRGTRPHWVALLVVSALMCAVGVLGAAGLLLPSQAPQPAGSGTDCIGTGFSAVLALAALCALLPGASGLALLRKSTRATRAAALASAALWLLACIPAAVVFASSAALLALQPPVPSAALGGLLLSGLLILAAVLYAVCVAAFLREAGRSGSGEVLR